MCQISNLVDVQRTIKEEEIVASLYPRNVFAIFFHYRCVYMFKTILADEKMDGLKFLMRTDVGINKVVDRL